ncbi:TrkH family potassium uptake protein [Geosporobacter ferrireducens]|uniref:Cation transporter n=1 Tax=Geosporobacter ferrireducens TaxID=1424294 RepID=A0A1D8GDQ2_9FIRM|nr:TrkH family potassium uptake protein [Geosporobacter ferrireducens]AOT69043.1 cation transporter [Geosporobacter ferrireducens]MTI56711.1 TrkH family potassium uptake protein [Geosporobacter ferrireducens]
MLYIEQLKDRYQLIIGYVGTIIIGIGLALLIPLLLLPIYRTEIHEVRYFVVPSLIAIVLGYGMRRVMKYGEEATLTLHEGGVIVLMAWVSAAIFSSMPFILSGKLNFTQAMFEAVSGLTTTGLSVVDVTETSHIFLLWRSLMQFIGGAGLAVIMLSAIIGPHGLGLYHAEGRSDKLLPNVARSTKLIMIIYIGYITSGVILYILAGMPWFDAVNHSISAVSTGGFSTNPDSIGAYESLPIELITIILMFFGTTNFAAHYLLLKGEVKRFFQIGEIRFMFLALAVAIPFTVYFSLLKLYGAAGKGIRVAIFELTSALTTTGYSTVGYGDWDSFAIFIMITIMIIGGGAGSTAGGLKQYRVYIMLKSLVWNIKGYLLPQNVVRQNYVIRPEGKYYVSPNHALEICNFAMLYMITYAAGVLVMLAHGYSLQDSMFEYASTLGTVGLSVGITAPDLPGMVLWAQIAGMMLGRLEFLVVFFAGLKIIKDIRIITKRKPKIS